LVDLDKITKQAEKMGAESEETEQSIDQNLYEQHQALFNKSRYKQAV
jgi:hypothetical protein